MKIQAISKQQFKGSPVKHPNKSSLNKLYAAIVPMMMLAPAATNAQYYSNSWNSMDNSYEDSSLRIKVEGEQKTKSTLILGAIAAAVGFLLTVDKKKK